MIDPEKKVSGVIYNGVRLTLAGSGESAPFIVKLTESEGVYSVDKTNQEIYDAMLDDTRVFITDDLFIMPLIFCQETEAIFACTADFINGPENVTVIVKSENGEQTVIFSDNPLLRPSDTEEAEAIEIDDEVTVDSDNLITSGAVATYVNEVLGAIENGAY